jgi:hypothetical protein
MRLSPLSGPPLLTAALLLASPVVAADGEPPPRILAADTQLSAAGLLADLEILRDAYGELHPGLRRYNTPEQLDAGYRELAREFSRDRTLADAYLALARFAARIRCGHTYANFYNQSEAVQRALFRSPRLPFHFRWLAERMVVERSFADDPRLRAGTEILAIDGRPVGEILRALLPLARADGGNDAKRASSLEVRGYDRFEAFDIYFPLLFPPPSATFELSLRNGETQAPESLRVSGQSLEARLAAMRAGADPGPEGAGWTLTFPRPRVGLLTMPTWALYDSQWNWTAFVDDAFAKLAAAGASDLVIDLRGNEGGLSVGDALVAHLIDRDLPANPVLRKVRYRSVPERLLPYLDTWDRSFDHWGKDAVAAEHGFYRLVRYDDDAAGAIFRPRGPRFGGRLWVLIGAANSSATFEFAGEVQRHGLGTLVGQPTGGNQRGINGGAFYFLRLPQSGLEVDLPLIAIFPDGDRPDAGLQPDIAVAPTVADIASGRDVELAAVFERIARPR